MVEHDALPEDKAASRSDVDGPRVSAVRDSSITDIRLYQLKKLEEVEIAKSTRTAKKSSTFQNRNHRQEPLVT